MENEISGTMQATADAEASRDYPIRIVTAASLFDGHDAAINIMRRIMQSKGAEVIHLGHNRSVYEIAKAALEEDADAVAVTSYQGGHMEFFTYLYDLLHDNQGSHILIFGGGGGTILPQEITELHNYGIARIYSPDDGRQMGLEGMIEDVLQKCRQQRKIRSMTSFSIPEESTPSSSRYVLQASRPVVQIARAITLAELQGEADDASRTEKRAPVLGITGSGGSGKSSLTDEIVLRFLEAYPDKTVAIIAVDPSRRRTGGALLGDRIRMNTAGDPRVYMRSLATRNQESSLSKAIRAALQVVQQASFDLIILESAGVGQGDTSIVDHCDVSLYVMTPEFGAASQLEKINMLDYADAIAINKFDKAGAEDAYMAVCKQYQRNHGLWQAKQESLPVVGTIASQFHDSGVNRLFQILIEKIESKTGFAFGKPRLQIAADQHPVFPAIIPPKRTRYLSDIADTIHRYNQWVREQTELASRWYQVEGTLAQLPDGAPEKQALENLRQQLLAALDPDCRSRIESWPALRQAYQQDELVYQVRGKDIRQPLFYTTLSGTRLPRVILPRYQDWGDVLRWQLQENVPGSFPYTAGVFPLKRTEEEPMRMFAGEGCPERTNKRFHYLAAEQPARRLSTAFDSVTLYGEDPAEQPDIYGKIGNSGVSIATLDDAKKLYSGFDLCDPHTSVSMTINGPAPIILAFFLNAAIDQQCEKWIDAHSQWDAVQARMEEIFAHHPRPVYYNPLAPGRLPDGHNGLGLRLLGVTGDQLLPRDVYEQIKARTLAQVRGTVQADILKEDQAQNTCIFSTEFALKLMGDVQEYFIQNRMRNFYSVSISGYHIAEAGANPITQLAFTLANGFTYVEYYLSRGMQVDDFMHNLSFFFSNGMDAEYSVIGRVARRIWAKAIRYLYKGNERSQKLKYHIQTSGRSLHAQEIDFNDIRTTLQALYAIYDNCNSLHTNAYDEAITTPTEESVRRAMAIQLIINRELGTAKTENFIQGSFLIEELTDLVEEAVLAEFERISSRGGVLGAMERMYQRNRIQEESLHYEALKHSGELPVIGVNTFLNKKGSPTMVPHEVIRSTKEEKEQQIFNLRAFQTRHADQASGMLSRLKQVARQQQNIFAELMETVKYCSLGQITHALYEVGGRYRRNM